MDSLEGYREVNHGADAALEVWAADLPGLFRQAAQGMFSLMGILTGLSEPQKIAFKMSAPDEEGLLVAFLSQLLFLLEQKELVITRYDLELKSGKLNARLEGFPVRSIQREIKAVTFNDLAIGRDGQGYRVVIVFDL